MQKSIYSAKAHVNLRPEHRAALEIEADRQGLSLSALLRTLISRSFRTPEANHFVEASKALEAAEAKKDRAFGALVEIALAPLEVA